MHDPDGLRTISRSRLRRCCGQAYYSFRRYLFWLSPGMRFAAFRQTESLPFLYARHETPLLRRLRDVEMIYQYNKVQNLRIACGRLDGILLHPGETLSYWKQIGRPTYAKGYLDGVILRSGEVTAGCGGGLCQLSNLIYWMTLHTPLTVTERHRHGYDVFPDAGRTQPFGSGATCFYPHGDLMLRNDTQDTFQLRLRVGERFLHGEWRCSSQPRFRYEVVERSHRMQGEWWGGYSRHNELYRLVYTREGKPLGEEFLAANHAMMMYEPLLGEGETHAGYVK